MIIARSFQTVRQALVTMLLCSATAAVADTNLTQEIKRADARFFTAFNQCDVPTMAQMFDGDLEFYHDLAGVSNYTETMAVTKHNCQRQLGLTRTLIATSLAVFPIKDFGAIQTGDHEFCHEVNGQPDCGTFGFTHVWKRTESGWKISRVVSYGH